MCFVRVYTYILRCCAFGTFENRYKGTASFLYACALSYQMMVQSYFAVIISITYTGYLMNIRCKV